MFESYALSNDNDEFCDQNKKYKVYTDTDSDEKTEIITDIECKMTNTDSKYFTMDVRVDPSSETNCTPLSHFRDLFPQLCKTSTGLPKETTLVYFEVYEGEIMKSYEWIILPTQNINNKKFYPVRYFGGEGRSQDPNKPCYSSMA